MRISEVIGRRIREARERRQWNQTRLGRELKPYLGKAWTAQMVSHAEHGGRDFIAAELVALAHVLRERVEFFFTPYSDEPLSLLREKKGRRLAADEVWGVVVGPKSTNREEWRETSMALIRRYREDIERLQAVIEHLQEPLETLQRIAASVPHDEEQERLEGGY